MRILRYLCLAFCTKNAAEKDDGCQLPRQRPVIIDGREYAKKRGIGHFVRELIFNINENADKNGVKFPFICIIPHNLDESLFYGLNNVSFIRAFYIDTVSWEQILLPIYAYLLDAHAIVSPYNTFPLVRPNRTKLIVICHDLIFYHSCRMRSGMRLKLGNIYRSWIFNKISHADCVLTVSNYTRDLLKRFCHIESSVIGNSVHHLAAVASALHFNRPKTPYFLHVGGDAGTKNSRAVVAAYQEAHRRFGANFPKLVVIGLTRNFATDLGWMEGCNDPIEMQFGISDSDKCALYNSATALIFPSLKEGFGLPVIEAHLFECRVITSRRRPLSDLVRLNDILVDPLSSEEIVQALLKCAREPQGSTCPDRWIPPNQYEVLVGALS